jgi:hypothetical protein
MSRPYQRNALVHPSIHLDLTDAIDVQVVHGLKRFEDVGALPTRIRKALAPERFLRSEIVLHLRMFGLDYETEHGRVAAHREATDLLSNVRVRNVDDPA